MGIVEQAVDAAANFIGPFVDAGAKYEAQRNNGSDYEKAALVREAIEHLQAINTSDLAADPDAPYDASLAGVVYGLLDLATSLGILPFLSSGVAFSQRPRSVLIATFAIPSSQSGELLSETINPLLSILKQKEGAGLQPLVAQRSLPDIVSALAELSGTSQDEWIQTLEPQLYNLLDGHEGRELSRAAGQIIAGGILILRYMTTVCDPRQIDTITTDLFWNGKLSWTLGSGSKGGIEIRMRRMKEANTATEMESMFARISDLTTRVDLFVSLLEDAKASDDVIGLIFLQVTKRWLRPAQNKKEILLLDSDDDPLMALTDAKLSEALASRFKASFARSPQHVVELMSQILRRYVSDHRIQSDRQMRSRGPSRTTLGSIVASRIGPEERYKAGDTADEDLASFAMSILITLVSTPDFKQTPTTNALLAEVAGHLQYLIRPQLHASIPPVVVNSANNLLGLLRSTALAPGPGEPDVDPLIKHRTVLKAALQDMTSPEAPNRTWALDTLRKLIQDHDSFPVIDIPSTTYLVLSASLADPESYVHSASVPVLVTLAIRAPHPVIKILVDALFDVDERSLKLSKGKMTDAKEQELQEALDYRLRVGEVLNNILLVDSFWQNSTDMPVKYASIKRICEACLSLTSRRGQRHQTRSTRKTVSLQILQQQKEAEAAWGGPIPNILEADDEASTADRADYVALNKIVKGWENTGIEEDVRIRASAMSIYGTILEKRLEFVNQATVDAGLQMVLLVMTIETAESFFILRRAAVLVVMGLLRAVDAKLEVGEESAVGLATKQQEEVERVVRWSRDEDGDELVRDHAASVVEGLETLRMKKLYRIRDEGMRLGPDLGLEGGLRGLNVRPEADEGQYRRKMILEEIE
ncbi:hypothetical protein N0V94_008656 [Neodidymelliopsis sp. IMI 364377]|nr:hypothetical protein N0V94_008656 [Neodidymelliopsis sp. IMI 364377]